jgi:hypothetical protein
MAMQTHINRLEAANDVCTLAMQTLQGFGNLTGVIRKSMAEHGLWPDNKKQIKATGCKTLATIAALLMVIEQQTGNE